MTPDHLRACLEALRWPQRELARALGVHERTIRRWAEGTALIPPVVAAWIKSAAEWHLANPPPAYIKHHRSKEAANVGI